MYNVAHRADDALIDALARDGIPYVPFFPLGGFTPLQSSTLSDVAKRLELTPMQVAHLRENLAAAELTLPEEALVALDGIATNAVAA
jgi:pyridoxine 4-dehydrogenase